LAPGKCVYVGFTSRDMLRENVPRVRRFIHVAGKSRLKNTEAVIAAWTRGRPDAQLTLVSRVHSPPKGTTGLTAYNWMSDDGLSTEMNRHMFHLCPSMYEGFGHILHEALSCGNVVLTTRAQPMNEFGVPMELTVQVNTNSHPRHNLAHLHPVRWQEVLDAVNYALSASPEKLETWRQQAREAYKRGQQDFQTRFRGLINSVCRR
jgi:hypothetical protein